MIRPICKFLVWPSLCKNDRRLDSLEAVIIIPLMPLTLLRTFVDLIIYQPLVFSQGSPEKEPVTCFCVCIRRALGRNCLTWLWSIVGPKSAGPTGCLKTQARLCFRSSPQDSGLLQNREDLIMQMKPKCNPKSSDSNVNVIKNTFTETFRTMFNQISGCPIAYPNFTHKLAITLSHATFHLKIFWNSPPFIGM